MDQPDHDRHRDHHRRPATSRSAPRSELRPSRVLPRPDQGGLIGGSYGSTSSSADFHHQDGHSGSLTAGNLATVEARSYVDAYAKSHGRRRWARRRRGDRRRSRRSGTTAVPSTLLDVTGGTITGRHVKLNALVEKMLAPGDHRHVRRGARRRLRRGVQRLGQQHHEGNPVGSGGRPGRHRADRREPERGSLRPLLRELRLPRRRHRRGLHGHPEHAGQGRRQQPRDHHHLRPDGHRQQPGGAPRPRLRHVRGLPRLRQRRRRARKLQRPEAGDLLAGPGRDARRAEPQARRRLGGQHRGDRQRQG